MENNFWEALIDRSLKKTGTPFYLFSSAPIEAQLNKMSSDCDFSAKCCLSIKTLPLKQLLKWWKKKDLFAEVTSEYELLAALSEGFAPNKIVVNGVAKHFWDTNVWVEGLRVNFDSLIEIERLYNIASNKKWHIGIRFHPTVQNDPENPSYSDQFGISSNNFKRACEIIMYRGLILENIHIHLRSNIPNLETFLLAIDELYNNINLIDIINIKSINIGGGLPSVGIIQKDSSWNSSFTIQDVNILKKYIQKKITNIQDVYYEYGRFLLSSCGILVFNIIDIKNINGEKFIICDGGRTNNAFPSDWEEHSIELYPMKSGKPIYFNLCGPTCMAYDCFAKTYLPENANVGDKIIYYDAGAYHLSWENRFSNPLANILWHEHENDSLSLIRKKESFEEWWRIKNDNT